MTPYFSKTGVSAIPRGASVDASIARTVNRITSAELIVIDDIGMLPAGQDAAETSLPRR